MKEVKIKITNKEGKEIIKNVPENLASLYLQQGWKLVEETTKAKPKQENRPFVIRTNELKNNEE